MSMIRVMVIAAIAVFASRAAVAETTCPPKASICGASVLKLGTAKDSLGAKISKDALYACTKAAGFRKVQACSLPATPPNQARVPTCRDVGPEQPDECITIGRPPLWEHGWAMLNIHDAASNGLDFPFAPPALYGTTCAADAKCTVVSSAGLLHVEHPAEPDQPIPLSYHNDAGPSVCLGCADQESCVLQTCVVDYTRVGKGWDTANAALLDAEDSISWRITPEETDPEWGKGAYASELAVVIMGEDISTSLTVGRIEIVRRKANGDLTDPPETIQLTTSDHIRAYAPPVGSPNAKPDLATQVYSGPCAGSFAGRTCVLDMQHFEFSLENQALPIETITIVADVPVRIHALSLRPARRVIVGADGKPIATGWQGSCESGGGYSTGGAPFEITCTKDADCAGGDFKCAIDAEGKGKCNLAWGTGRSLGATGCVISSLAMILNYYGIGLPDFIAIDGSAQALKPPPHNQADLNRWLQLREKMFKAIETGAAKTRNLDSQIDYIPTICSAKAGGGTKPKEEFAKALGESDAQAFCDLALPIATTWRPKLLPDGELLEAGRYLEITPGNSAYFAAVSRTLECGKPKKLVRQRPVLRIGDKDVALLEIEEHPLHPANMGTCVSPQPPPQPPKPPETDFMKRWREFARPMIDTATRLPCTANYVARIVHVIEPGTRLSTEASTWAYVELLVPNVTRALELNTERWAFDSLPKGGPASYGDVLGTLAANMIVNSEPVLVRVKANAHTVLGVGLDSTWFAKPFDAPLVGLGTKPSGAWQGTILVNDPQVGKLQELYFGNNPLPNKPQKGDVDRNGFVILTRVTPKTVKQFGRTIVQVQTHSPAVAVVTAADGTRSGFFPNGQGAVVETAGATLDEAQEDVAADPDVPEEADSETPPTERFRDITLIDPPAGPLGVDLTGTAPGPVTVDVVVTDPDGGIHSKRVQYFAARDQVVSFDIVPPSGPGGVLIVTPRSPVDADQDSISPPADCDDADKAIHPRAVEACDDGIDNDCDGLTDGLDPECDAPLPCPDRDGDGYFDCAEKGCDATGMLCGDCNDYEGTANPGRAEDADAPVVCLDGIDNDCDGLTDGEERACLRLPYPQIGDLCLLDIQCGDVLFCDNFLGGGVPTFTCQTRKGGGAACFKSDVCSSGQCGLGKCCDDPATCPSLDLYLGKSLGSIKLETVLPSGCYSGSVAVTPCTGLPFCNIDVEACKDGSAWNNVTVSAQAAAGPLGMVAVNGKWDDTGKGCLEGDAPNPTGLPLSLSNLHLTVCEDGSGGSAMSIDGTSVVSGKPVTFSGEIVTVGTGWTMTLHADSLVFGSITISDVTLTLSKSSPTVAISGRLRDSISNLDLHVSGSYLDSGPVDLDLALDGGTSWSPAPGLTFSTLEGQLHRDAAGSWSATLHVDSTVDVGPLPDIAVEGDLTFDGATGRFSGCLGAKSGDTQGSPLVGVPLNDLKVTVCVNEGGVGRVAANVSGSTTLFGATKSTLFTGSLGVGPVWHLSLDVGEVTLGVFKATATSFEIVGKESTVQSTRLRAQITVGTGPTALELVGIGTYSSNGPMSLALSLASESGWSPAPGVTFFDASGTLDRDAAGAWSGTLAVDSQVDLGPLKSIHVKGDLALSATSASGCLSADASRDQGTRVLGPVSLDHLSATLCVNEGNPAVTSATLDGTVRLFGGAPTTFTGLVVVTDPWAVSLSLTDFALGPLALDSATLVAKPAGAGVDLKLDVALTLGTGSSALALLASGGYVSNGPMTFEVSNTAAWTPVAGLTFDTIGGTVTRAASGAVAISLSVGTKVDLGPLAQVDLTGLLEVDTATERITGCLTADAFDTELAFVPINDVAVTACLGHDGIGPTFSASLTASAVVFGKVTNVTGTIKTSPKKTLVLTLEDLSLPPFTVDTATLTIEQPPTGNATAMFDGNLTFGTGDGALHLRAFGAHSASGNVALEMALLSPWTPAPGFTVSTATGTLSRAGAVWSGSLSFSTTVSFGPFGSFTVTATNVTLNGATKAISFDATVAGKVSPTIALIPFGNVTLGVHVETSATGVVTANGTASGTVTLFGASPQFVATMSLTDPFVATLSVGDLTLNGFVLNKSQLTLTQPSGGATSLSLSGEATFGKGAGALTVVGSGTYVHPGNVNLTLAMKPGTTWTPAPGVTVSTVKGTLNRAGNVTSATLDLGASVVVGPLGTVNLTGSMVFAGGDSFTGCFGAAGSPLPTTPIGGVSLTDLTAQACMVSDAAGNSRMNFTLAGKAVLQGGALGAFTGSLALADTGWTAILNVKDLNLGGFTVPTAILTIVQGPAGAPSITLSGRLIVGGDVSALTLDINGSYKPASGFSLTLSIPAGTPWRPLTGIEIPTLAGTLDFDGTSYKLTFAGSTTTTVALPILGSVTVTGTFNSAFVNGKASISGCLAGALPLTALQSLPGASGTAATVKVCIADGVPDVTIGLVGAFSPLPGLTVGEVTGKLQYVTVPGGGSATVPELSFHVGPVTWTPVAGFSVTGAVADARLTQGGTWSIAASGTTTFTIGGFTLSLAITGSLSDDGHVRLSGTYLGTLKPIPLLDFLSLTNPTVSLDINTTASTVGVTLAGVVSIDLFGVMVSVSIQGGATLGGSSGFFFTGEVAASEDNPILLPGFPPITGTLCLGASTTALTGIAFCGKPSINLDPGLTVMAISDLPVILVDDQPKAAILLNLQSLTHLFIEASLDFDWTLIKKSDGLPTIDTVTLGSLSLFADINGANVEVGFGASMAFKPSNQVTPIQGKAEISFTPPSTIGATLFLNGRWMEPLTIPKIAIQSPGATIGITIPPPPAVPIPTRFGIQGDLFWLKSGAFPAENLDFSEKCGNFTDDDGDGKIDCADSSCAGKDLYCVPNVATVGGTLFFDTIPTESGICIGPCLPLPTILVRFILKSFGLEDVAKILNDIRAGAVGVMTSFSPVIGQALGSVPVPTVNFAPLSASINELSFYVSTHNKELFGDRYGPGLAAKLDVTVNNKNLLLAGSVDSNGLMIQGRASPFKLLGVNLIGNPFARIAKLNSGDILVAHDVALDAPLGTVEAWVQKASWPTTAVSSGALPVVIAAKETATTGWTIGAGEAVGGKGRVIVRLRKAGSPERIVRTDPVLLGATGTHVAVTFEPSGPNTRIVVWVNGEKVPLSMTVDAKVVTDSGLSSFAPVKTTQPLILGKGLDTMDDVRLWKVVRPSALIAGQARVLPPESVTSADLTARYEFDYDAGATANNAKLVTGATTAAGKLHGTYRTTAVSAVSPDGQDLFFKLGLLLNGGAENGLVAQAGIDMPLPLGGTLKASSMVQIADGKAEGRMYAKDIELLAFPFFGKLMLGGFGPNGVANDFDDGLFATFDLLKMTFSGSGRLAQVKPDGTMQVFAQGTAALACASPANCSITAPHVLSASGSVDLTASPPLIGQTGVQGSGSFSTAKQQLDVNGKIVVGGREFASGAIKATPAAIEVTASTKLSVLGIDLGSVSLALKLDFAAKTFCGSGTYDPPNGSPLKGKGACTVDACFGQNTTLGVTCGGVQFCVSNDNCSGGKVCVLGFCAPPLADGTACLLGSQCLHERCGGVPLKCYTKHSKGDGDTCYFPTLDHCEEGFLCLPIGNTFKCFELNLPHQSPCTDSKQCAPGLACVTGTNFGASSPVKQCLKNDLSDGTGCANDVECKPQHVCTITLNGKQCACNGDSTCSNSQYCDYSCKAKKANGVSCGGANQCTSTACGGGVCYGRHTRNLEETCVADDHCKSDFCHFGKCKCNNDNDCTATEHCDGNACLGPVGEGASCQSNRWCTGTTPCLNTGDVTKPKACLTANSKAMGAACVADIQCTSGRCPGAAALGKTCKCDSNSDCASNKYCEFDLLGDTGTCNNKKGDFGDCSTNSECTGGSCGGGIGGQFKKCYTPDARSNNQTCVHNNHCSGTLKCDGKCYQPDSQNTGQSCINNDHCKTNFCLLGKCRCDSNSDCSSSQFCGLVEGSCLSKKPGGEICFTDSNQCQSGKCSWGKCGCYKHSDCPSNQYCENNYCDAKRNIDKWCDHDYHCKSGNCKSVKTHCFLGACTYENKCRP